MRIFLKYWLPVLTWAGFIFIISSLPKEDIHSILYGQDILFHIFEYTLLALLLNRAFKNSGFLSLYKSKRLFWVILISLIYAMSDEFHQQFVPGRLCSIGDFVVDGFGVVLGSLIYQMNPRLSER